jgi:hypothetical protein
MAPKFGRPNKEHGTKTKNASVEQIRNLNCRIF